MGWASGSEVFDPVAKALIDGGADDTLKTNVCSVLINQLRERGWDTEEESLGLFEEDDAIVRAFRQNGITLKCHEEHDTETWVCEEDRGHCDSHRDYAGNTWTDIDLLDGLVASYIDITDPDGKGLSGIVVAVYPDCEVARDGIPGRLIVVDYGYEWFVTATTKVHVKENPEGE
jgi:hypothetical protein